MHAFCLSTLSLAVLILKNAFFHLHFSPPNNASSVGRSHLVARWPVDNIFPGAADTTPGGGRMTDDGDDGRTGAGGWVVQITTVAYPPNSHSSALDHFKPCSHVVM